MGPMLAMRQPGLSHAGSNPGSRELVATSTMSMPDTACSVLSTGSKGRASALAASSAKRLRRSASRLKTRISVMVRTQLMPSSSATALRPVPSNPSLSGRSGARCLTAAPTEAPVRSVLKG